MNGRIKPGSACMQDHSFFHWPDVPHLKYPIDPNITFTMSKSGEHIKCIADGFGILGGGRYGNGAIYVFSGPKEQK
jgi:hypothetical protein